MKTMKQHLLKKALAAVFTLTLAVGATACGSGTSPASTSTPTSTPSATSTPASTTTPSAEPSQASGAKVNKIALLLPGSITDQSWNTSAYKGLEILKGEGYETAYTENVEVANIEAAFRNYANEGYDLIIGHGFQFGDAAIRVAAEYPEKYFFVFGKQPDSVEATANVGFVDQKEFEGAYLCGVLAASVSKTGIIAHLGGIEGPSQVAGKNAYIAGAKSVNPDIVVLSVMAGTFSDPAKGKEAALAQIEQGADVLMHTCDTTGLGLIEAAKEKGVYTIGYGADQSDLAPELMLTSLMVSIPDVIASQVYRIDTGEFSGVWKPGLKDNVVGIAKFGPAVPAEAQATVEDIYKKILSDELAVEEIYD